MMTNVDNRSSPGRSPVTTRRCQHVSASTPPGCVEISRLKAVSRNAQPEPGAERVGVHREHRAAPAGHSRPGDGALAGGAGLLLMGLARHGAGFDFDLGVNISG